MVLQVSDTASNRREQIANFAELLRNAPARQKVFIAVYRGKKASKTVQEISDATGYDPKRVTEIAKPLARGEKLFQQDRERVNGKTRTVYRKLDFVLSNRKKILRLAADKKNLDAYHTKSNPRIAGIKSQMVTIRVPFRVKTTFIKIDDVEQFSKVKGIRTVPPKLSPERLPEKEVKAGLSRLLKETKVPKDWGGESNDIFTTKLKINTRTFRAAFALKGPAKMGTLVPGMMGKNGDQIQRLFNSPAEVFFVQYEGEIGERVIELMEQLAKAKAITGGDVLYGVIDRSDTYRLRLVVRYKVCKAG